MIVACCCSGLFVCINGCFMLDGFVDLVLAVFGVLVDVVWCCAFGLRLLRSFVVDCGWLGLVTLCCLGVWFAFVSVFGWVCFDLDVCFSVQLLCLIHNLQVGCC